MPPAPEDWSALQQSSEYAVSLGGGLPGGPQPLPRRPKVQDMSVSGEAGGREGGKASLSPLAAREEIGSASVPGAASLGCG